MCVCVCVINKLNFISKREKTDAIIIIIIYTRKKNDLVHIIPKSL